MMLRGAANFIGAPVTSARREIGHIVFSKLILSEPAVEHKIRSTSPGTSGEYISTYPS
jgi:hypothetical protein